MANVPRQLQPLSWKIKLRRLWNRSRVVLTASGVAAAVLGLRYTGFLQPLELGAIDQSFRWRSEPPKDERIVIIGVDENDIQQLGWPLTDERLADLLQQLITAKARVIGLDIYRDAVKPPGETKLQQIFKTNPNIVGITLLRDDETAKLGRRWDVDSHFAVPPPPLLEARGQVGFNNTLRDVDQRVRRSVLFWQTKASPEAPPKLYESFSLNIAQRYLKPAGIEAQAVSGRRKPRVMQLGQAILPPLSPFAGVYTGVDSGGYQILADYRGDVGKFDIVPLADVFDRKIPPETFNDRIVLIGSLAPSLKDDVATPFSSAKQAKMSSLMSGVELQANFISQLITAAQTGQGIFQTLPEGVEWLWILAAAYWGTYASWRLRSPEKTIVAMSLSSLGVIGLGYSAFLGYRIVPVVPPLLALLLASAVVTSYIAHAEGELQRSKEFLHRIINSIPDPIFVKSRRHEWIVLNQAYADLYGLSVDELLGKSATEVLPVDQADRHRLQDNWVFDHQLPQEVEEEFVNLQGQRYHISTKRSLHKDSAGNLFLVGVIHDITQRKSLEEELKRTRDQLFHDNSELSYLANHDPLTTLPNRKLFLERLQQALETAAEANHPHHQVALLFLDLDGFKQVNDTLGHGVGDLLLQAVAKRLLSCLRAGSDTVARLGGDEFVVILPNLPGPLVAKRVAQKILSTLDEEFTFNGHTIHVTSSIGISLYPTDSTNLDGLLQKADEAMYQAKASGKNQLFFAKSMNAAKLSPRNESRW